MKRGSESHSVMSNSLQPHGLCSPWNSPGRNTGVGSLSILQGIFPTQELNQGLLHCGRLLYQLSYLESPPVREELLNWKIWRQYGIVKRLHVGTAAAAKSLQSCPTLCDPRDGSPLGSSVPGILQARILEWVAISFSNEWKWKVKVKSLSRAWLLATPWTAAYQASLSMGFSRQEYWSGVPLPLCHVGTDDINFPPMKLEMIIW